METIAKLEFKTPDGREYSCSIDSLSALSSTVPYLFTGSSNPLHIRLLQSGNSTESPMKSSEAVLSVINKEAFKAYGFLSLGNRSARVRITEKKIIIENGEVTILNQLIWVGFMVPDQWSETYPYLPYETQFTFIDGLALLKNEDFVDDNGCRVLGRVPLWRVVTSAIRKIGHTGITQRVVDQINIMDINATHDERDKGYLWQKWVDLEAFVGLTYWEVLEKILISCHSRIEYRNNKYYLVRINQTDDKVWSVEWGVIPFQASQMDNPPIESQYWEEKRIELTTGVNTGRICWQDNSQQMLRLPGWKHIDVTQVYGRKESFIRRSLFTECDFDDAGLLRGWSSNGVRKHVSGDDVLIEFEWWGRRTAADPVDPNDKFTPPAFVQTQTADVYSREGIPEDDPDLFELQIVCRNRDLDPVKFGPQVYAGPGGTGTTISSGSDPSRPQGGSAAGRDGQTTQQTVTAVPPSSAIGSYENDVSILITAHPDLDGVFFLNSYQLFEKYGIESLENYYVRFSRAQVEELEEGETSIIPNMPYRVTDWQPQPPPPEEALTQAFFRITQSLSDESSSWLTDFPKESEWNVIINSTVMPISLQTSSGQFFPNHFLSTDGLWGTTRRDIFLHISDRDLVSRSYFSTGIVSINLMPDSGGDFRTFFLRIQKPSPIQAEGNRYYHGRFRIESVRLRIAELPESNFEKIKLNAQNNLTGTVELWFAETPIKGTFINNNLKFHNNFYSLSLTEQPGGQYYYKFPEEEPESIQLHPFLPEDDYGTNNFSLSFSVSGAYSFVADEWRSYTEYALSLGGFALSWYLSAEDNSAGDLSGMRIGRGFAAGTTFHAFWQDSFDAAESTFLVRFCRIVTSNDPSSGQEAAPYIGNDGRAYKTIRIGNRVWTAENLKETMFYDGSVIPLETDMEAWKTLTTGARTYRPVETSPGINTSEEMVEAYGYFYNGLAAKQLMAQSLANRNNSSLSVRQWRIPKQEDWKDLMDTIAANTPYTNNEKTGTIAFDGTAGKALLISEAGQTGSFDEDPIVPGTLYDITTNFYRQLYTQPRTMLTGVINCSKEKTVFGKIMFEKHLNTLNQLIYADWNVRMNEFETMWHEIGDATLLDDPQTGEYNEDYNDDYKI